MYPGLVILVSVQPAVNSKYKKTLAVLYTQLYSLVTDKHKHRLYQSVHPGARLITRGIRVRTINYVASKTPLSDLHFSQSYFLVAKGGSMRGLIFIFLTRKKILE